MNNEEWGRAHALIIHDSSLIINRSFLLALPQEKYRNGTPSSKSIGQDLTNGRNCQ
jgi:hypothetical protein